MATLYLATFFINNVSTGLGTPLTFSSLDGITFTWLSNMTAIPSASSHGSRDPSIMFNPSDGLFYMVTSGGVANDVFELYSTPFLGTPWTYLGDVATGIGTMSGLVAAPDWFVDPSTGDIYVAFQGSTTSPTTNFGIYIISPTGAGNWTNSTWGSPTLILSPTASGVTQPMYDPNITYSGGTYYLYAHNDSCIGVFTASSLTGAWTNQSNAVVSGSQEGPCLLEVGSLWTLYFDLDGAILATGFINYATQGSWPGTLTFTASPTPIGVNLAQIASAYIKQGTVIKFNGAAALAPITPLTMFKPRVSAGTLQSFTPAQSFRLGLARLGAARLGSGGAPAPVTISPGGLASGFHAGTPNLEYNQNLSPGGKASDFAAGAPSVLHVGVISPAGKGSDFAPGMPTLSLGTITPSGKSSDFVAGVPFLNLFQDIAPTGLPSAFAAGRPTLLPAKVISPGGLGTGFAAGLPIVSGGPQRISPAGLASGFGAGVPTLSGGVGGLRIWIGGVDFTKYLMNQGTANPGADAQTTAQPLQLTSQTLGRWTAIFDICDVAMSVFPEIDQTVLIQENGVTIFAGGLITVQLDRFDMGSPFQSYHCTAQDWSAICDRRIVSATYLAGTDVSSVFLDIWQQVLQYPNEGLTANGVAPTGTDTLDQNEVFNLQTVTQAFDQICTDQGWAWWVDVHGDIHATPNASLPPCPFSLTETSHNFRALSATSTLVDYRNVQWVSSNLVAVPGVAVQSTTGGATPGTPGYGGPVTTDTYVLPQAAATARGFVLGAIITNLAIMQITSLTVNGVAQPVQLGTAEYNLQKSWWYFPGFPFVYAPYAGNNSPGFPYPPVTSPYPNIGDTVVVSYIPIQTAQGAVIQSGGSPLVPATPGSARTWGSGTFENVQQVKNINLQSDLNALALALLNRSDFVPTQVQFETDSPGAQVGQTISINLPPSFIPSTDAFIITSIQATRATGVLEAGSSFKWVIQATTGQDIGNAVKWFERLVARTENALAVQQFTEQNWILSPGQSVTNASAPENPIVLQAGGALVQAYAIAGTPPTNQNLVIDILDNGVSILGAGNQIIIPAGELDPVYVRTFALPTVAIGDSLTLSLSYQVGSGIPLPAASVTVSLRWSTPGLPAGQTLPGVYADYISGTPNVTTAMLPAGVSGTAYVGLMTAGGGTPPYTWTSGALPPGLVMDASGNITGTPTTPGSYAVVFTATDSSSPAQTATATLTIVIT